ncbi:MAG: acylphosphatase [Nitrococcus sp.]|nr:acylphosphatase [Nitrococcus sp.]
MSVRCIRCYVSGRVQGVFYRASTRERAVQLGLRGYVRNLSDGRVEVVACGDAVALDSLAAWLREGSPRSLVSDLRVEPAPDPGLQEFDIR